MLLRVVWVLPCLIAVSSVAGARDLFDVPDHTVVLDEESFVALLTPGITDHPILTLNKAPEVCAGFLASWRRAYRGADALMSLDGHLDGWDIDVVSERFDTGESDEFEVIRSKTEYSDARIVIWKVDLNGDGIEEGLIFERFNHSWRGDWHPVWIAPNGSLSAASEQAASGAPRFGDVEGVQNVVRQNWTQPLVLQAADGAVYLHQRFSLKSHANDTLSRITPDALEPVCRVDFSVEADAPALDRLMKTVQRSQGEEFFRCGGTLRALDRVKGKGNTAADNFLMRPWALELPYDSRETINKALELWSFSDPWSRQVYLKLAAQIAPAVEETKARLSRTHPDLSSDDREWLAEETVWRTIGANYIFGRNANFGLQAPEHIAQLYRGDMTPAEVKARSTELDPTDYNLLFAALDYPALLDAILPIVPVDADDGTGKTALMYAAQLDNIAAVNKLLEEGANPNSKTIESDDLGFCGSRRGGVTPLHYALGFAGQTVIERLLDAGGDPDLVADDGTGSDNFLERNSILKAEEKKVIELLLTSD